MRLSKYQMWLLKAGDILFVRGSATRISELAQEPLIMAKHTEPIEAVARVLPLNEQNNLSPHLLLCVYPSACYHQDPCLITCLSG